MTDYEKAIELIKQREAIIRKILSPEQYEKRKMLLKKVTKKQLSLFDISYI